MAPFGNVVRRPVRADLLIRPQVVVLALMVGGLVLRLRKAWAELSALLLQPVGDDAFYYFQIARNMANGRYATFDGENLTNGFHPLWAAVLTPIYLVIDDRELALRVGLTVGALLGVGTVLLVYAIARTLTGNPWAAVVAAAFYAIHPYVIIESVNGMETALALFLLALTMWLHVRLVSAEGRATSARYAWLGVAAGFMVLARTDMALILPPILLHIVVQRGGWAGCRAALGTAAAALLVVAPWAIWSLASFGTVIQVSGIAVPDIERQAFLDAHGSSLPTQLNRAWDVTNSVFLHQLPHLFFVPRGGPRVPSLLAGAGVIGFMLLAPLAPQRRQVRRQMGLLLAPTAGVVLVLLFHSAIRWHVRDWYYAPMGLVCAAILGVAVSYFASLARGTRLTWRPDGARRGPAESGPPKPGRWRGWAAAALYVMIVLAMAGFYGQEQSDRWLWKLPHRLNMLQAARWLAANTEPDARIGAFNAGIFGYFSERTVVNLDGVVNEDAYRARRDGRTMDYICAQRIGYLVDLELDYAASWRCSSDPSARFELVTTIGEPLFYFRGGRVDVLELVSTPSSGTSEFGRQD